MLIGGICSIEDLDTAIREGFEFVEVGRAIIKDPDIVNKWSRGDVATSDCDHCNRCIPEMDRGGVACVCNKEGPLVIRRKGVGANYRV